MNNIRVVSAKRWVNSRQPRMLQRSVDTGPLSHIEMEKTRILPTIKKSALTIEMEQPHEASRAGMTAIAVALEETRQTPAVGIPVVPRNGQPTTQPGIQLWARAPSTRSLDSTGVAGSIEALSIYRVRSRLLNQNILSLLQRRERVVFLLVDGKRTVRDIAGLLHRSEQDIASILARFLHQGLIEQLSP